MILLGAGIGFLVGVLLMHCLVRTHLATGAGVVAGSAAGATFGVHSSMADAWRNAGVRRAEGDQRTQEIDLQWEPGRAVPFMSDPLTPPAQAGIFRPRRARRAVAPLERAGRDGFMSAARLRRRHGSTARDNTRAIASGRWVAHENTR